MNFPDFSYRQSYDFVCNIINAVMKPEPDEFEDYIYATSIVYRLPKQFLCHNVFEYENFCAVSDYYNNKKVIIDGKTFYNFFQNVLMCFHYYNKDSDAEKQKEEQKIINMVEMVKKRINPFKIKKI